MVSYCGALVQQHQAAVMQKERSFCHSDNAGFCNFYTFIYLFIFQFAVLLASQFYLLLYPNPQIIEDCSDFLAPDSQISNYYLKQTP